MNNGDYELQKKGIEIAKRLLKEYKPPSQRGKSSKEKNITKSNLQNLLEAAREAEKVGSFDLFRLKAAYVAREAKWRDPLFQFVSGLVREINSSANKEEDKIKLAIHAVTACIYIFTAITNNMKNLIYPEG